MSRLDDLRRLYPDLADQDDEALINGVSERSRVPAARVRAIYSAPPAPAREAQPFRDGVRSGIQQTQATGYGVLGLAGHTLANATGEGRINDLAVNVRDYGFAGYNRNMAEAAQYNRPEYSWEAFREDPTNAWGAARYYAGQFAPDLVGSALSMGTGGLIAAGVRRGAREGVEAVVENQARRQVGQLAGAATYAVGQSLGETYGQAGNEAIQDGGTLDDVNIGRVYGYGGAAGLVETASDVATLGLARFGPARNLMDIVGNSRLPARIAARGATASAIEGTTEGIQSGLQDMGAGATFDEARWFDPDAVYAGALGGGVIGGATGLLPRREEPLDEQALQAENARFAAEQQAAQQQADAQAAQVEQQRTQTAAARVAYGSSFVTADEFAQTRTASRLAEVQNPETPAGQEFQAWLVEQAAEGNVPITPEDYAAFATEFLEGNTPADDADTARAEYIAALDQHTQRMAALEDTVDRVASSTRTAALTAGTATIDAGTQAAETDTTTEDAPEAPDPIAQAIEILEARGTEMNEQRVAQLRAGMERVLALPDDARRPALRAVMADLARPPKKTQAKSAAKNAKATAPQAATAAPAATPATPAPEPRRTKKDEAREYAAQQLGESWEVDNPDLSQMVEDGKSIYGANSRFRRRVDAAVKERDAPQQTQEEPGTAVATPEEAAEAVGVLLSPEIIQEAGLSGNEGKVFRALSEAFANNEQDAVLQPDGTWNTAEIGRRAGIGPKQGNVMVKRVMTKLAKAGGMTPDQARERLRTLGKARRQGEAAPDIDAPVSVFDQSELAATGGTGTVASANQGAYTGVKAEDKAFTEQLSEQPNEVLEARIAERQEANRQAELAELERVKPGLARMWDNRKSGPAPSFDDLSPENQIDWMRSVMEWMVSDDADGKDATLLEDQRELERITDEGADAARTAVRGPDEAVDADPGGDVPGVEGPGGRTDAEAAAPAGRVGQERAVRDDVEDAEVVGEQPDTGVVGEAKARPTVETKNWRLLKRKLNRPNFGALNDDFSAFVVASTESVRNVLEDLTGQRNDDRVNVVQTAEEAAQAMEDAGFEPEDIQAVREGDTFGFAYPSSAGGRVALLIAERIPAGGERAAFMHEVGVHVGLDAVLTTDQRVALNRQILDWATKDDGSLESTLARRAVARFEAGRILGVYEDADAAFELPAYFAEEAVTAGVEPTVSTPAGRLLRQLFAALRSALRKLDLVADKTVTAQDMVDMAWGAAGFELSGQRRGSGVQFRHFNEDFMGAERAEPEGGEVRFGVAQEWGEKNFGGEKTSQFVADMKAVYKNPLAATKFLSRDVRDVRDDMPSAGRWYDAMTAAQETVKSILRDVERIISPTRRMAPERLALVNDLIGDATFQQKWPYDPKFEGRTVTVDPEMARRFKALKPEEQQVVRQVFDHGEKMLKQMRELSKAMGAPELFKFHSGMKGPYAPLKRFGNHAGELKSQALLDAEKLAARSNTKFNRERVEKLKSNGDHYVISFFDTPGAAKVFVDAHKDQYAYAAASERALESMNPLGESSAAYEKMLGALRAKQGEAGLDTQTRLAVEKLVKELYYASLDERNARLSGARRMNRAGFDKDMIRSFVSNANSQANLIAQMKHGGEINTALITMRKEAGKDAGKDTERLMPVYNRFARKYQNIMTPRTGFMDRVQDNILAFNTVFMLTSSIGYHIQNATQPTISAAKIAGDFGGAGVYAKTLGNLVKGYKIGKDVIQGAGLWKHAATVATVGFVDLNNEVDIDSSKAPPEYRALLKTLQNRGLLDVGVEEDLNVENRFDTGYEVLNKAKDAFTNVTHRLYQVARYVEANNRVSSAIAAYDAAKANPEALKRMKMTPEEYAISVVEDTQGNFSNLDAPLLIDSLPRVTTQFRKYQLMMGWLYGRAFSDAFKGATPHERAAGRRTLGYLLANVALLSGATGVPFATTVVPWFLAASGDEEEPQDLERWIREELFPDNEDLADMLARGVPAFFGLDMSTKLQQSDIFLPYNPNFVSFEATPDGALDYVASLFFGPTSTMVRNFGSAAQFFEQGDIPRATEYLVPRGARSALETYRFSTEGYTLRNGDVIYDPRDFNAWDLFTNAIGLPSTDVNQIKWTRGQQYELEQWFSGESSRIRREYVDAHQARDREAMSALRAEFRSLQDAKDRVRPFFNDSRDVLRRQPVSDLLRAPRDQRTREDRYRASMGTD